MSLSCEELDCDAFDRLEVEWGQLLSNSCADPLVMSWAWMRTWWRVFGESSDDRELRLLCVRDSAGALVGIAPLYLQDFTQFGSRCSRLQFLAGCWRDSDNIRCEYVDFIVHAGFEHQVVGALLDYVLHEWRWDEFVICNHWVKSESYRSLREFCRANGYLFRQHEKGYSHRLQLVGTFADYLSGLSGRTRSQIFNQRKRLEAHGDVSIRQATSTDLDGVFDLLNRFHELRWGKRVFEGNRKEFHRRISRLLLQKGELEFTLLCVQGKPVSALYDFVIGSVKYGYQTGFDRDFDKRLSISKLHMGYSIESAFEKGLQAFDFLRGGGQRAGNYKDNLAQPYRETATLQIVRSQKRKLLYQLYERMPNQLRVFVRALPN